MVTAHSGRYPHHARSKDLAARKTIPFPKDDQEPLHVRIPNPSCAIGSFDLTATPNSAKNFILHYFPM
jgi:hypothetical protein